MTTRHPNEDTLWQYISEDANDETLLDVDTHVARCPSCAERIRTLRGLQEDFDSLFDSWTAIEHGRVYQRWCLLKAVREAAKAAPPMAERLFQLFECLKTGMVLCIKVLVDRSRKLACLAREEGSADCVLRLCPSYAGVGSPEAQAELDAHLKESCELLSLGRVAEATEVLLQAEKIDARSTQATTSTVYRDEQLVAEAAVDSRRGRISVILWPGQRKVRAQAILLPVKAPAEAIATVFERVQGQPYLLAEFEDVCHEVYHLWIACLS